MKEEEKRTLEVHLSSFQLFMLHSNGMLEIEETEITEMTDRFTMIITTIQINTAKKYSYALVLIDWSYTEKCPTNIQQTTNPTADPKNALRLLGEKDILRNRHFHLSLVIRIMYGKFMRFIWLLTDAIVKTDVE